MNKSITDLTPEQIQANRRASRKRRGKAMIWSFLFIVLSAMILPTASYLVDGPQGQAVAQSSGNMNEGTISGSNNNRANFWEAVRKGQSGYSAVPGAESGVLINNGAQNWRQLRNGVIANYGRWALVGMLGIIALFFLIRGRVKIEEAESGLTLPRWQVWERAMHWYTAILFILLAISGLSMLFGREVLIPLLGAKGFASWANLSINVHNYIGPFFALGVFAMLLFWVRHNIPKGYDLTWFAKGGGMFGKAHPPAGKANGGEKVWFWIVIFVGLVAVCGSGFVLIGWATELGLVADTRDTMQLAHKVHAIASIIWICVFFGHAYIGSLGTEGVLEGMTSGRVSVEWAKQHHNLWYEQVKGKSERTEQPTSSSSSASASAT